MNIENIKRKLKDLPLTSGVYLMKDIDGNIIYVGKAKNLKRRVSSYFLNTEKNIKTSLLVDNIYDFSYIVTLSEMDALALESNLIKKYTPYYNILLKDGKQMPYLRIDIKNDYPNITIARKVKKDGAKYFGPYFAGIRAGELLKIIYSAYPLRQCKLNLSRPQKRECLNYSLGLCSAPCTRRISMEDYKKIINQVMNFLRGNDSEVEKILYQKMLKASEHEQFEMAITYREQLKIVQKLKSRVILQLPKTINLDIFSYVSNGEYGAVSISVVRGGKMIGCETYTVFNTEPPINELLSTVIAQYYAHNLVPELILLPQEFDDISVLNQFFATINACPSIEQPKIGIKAKLLETNKNNAIEFLEKQIDKEKYHRAFTIGAVEILKKNLNLERLPLRIEAYDISNISGTNSVASMVVFINGEPKKSHYRKFIIKTVVGADDFASMAETITRRFNEYILGKDESFSTLPDLIVIDGGKGQLSHAYSSMQAMGITTQMVGLAKQDETVFKLNESEGIKLDKSNFGLRLLQRVRDESHRFAIMFHRSKREKISSILENIPAIGKQKAKVLLKHFGSIDAISNATTDELKEVDGIGDKHAQNIFDYFNSKKNQ